MLMKLSLFFLKLLFLERVLLGLEGGEEEADPGKWGLFGVVGGEENVGGDTGVVGIVGVLDFTGVDGGCLAGSPFAIPLPVPLGVASSGLGCFLSSSFFSERRVLEEEVPVEAFLGLLIGRAWVEGVSVCLGGSTTGGRLSAVLGSFTGTKTSGDLRLAGVGRTVETLSGADTSLAWKSV